jgi:DNA-binding MarR family transcriptional regulator
MRAQRELTAQIVMFNQAVAERAGLNATETQCLNLISVNAGAPLAAGQLAEMIGLSTGAMTRLIDRLERAGYVRRVKSPTDRRTVIVEPRPEQASKVSQFYASTRDSWNAAMANYDDSQIAFLVEYIERGGKLMHDEAGKLRAGGAKRR